MSFIDSNLLAEFEGKFLRFANGVTRKLRLVRFEKLEPDEALGRKYEVKRFTVIDEQTGQEKTFDADFGFIRAFTQVNDQVGEGSVIIVNPRSYIAGGKERFAYDITVDNS